jgi:hypothetical protein
MNVSYTGPLQQSWERMVRMLFRPFRLEMWLTLGFAAFLSEYLSHGSGGGGKDFSFKHKIHAPFPDVARKVAEFLLDPVWGPIAILIAVCAITMGLIFLWVSCRGKFIFLDNVMHERAAIVEPWKAYARLGNSLFRFWLVFAILVVALFVMISFPLLPALFGAIAAGGAWHAFGVLAVAWWVAAMVPFAVLVGCTYVFLSHFVVSIMYRDGIGVMAAWSRFFSLFRTNVLNFIAYVFFCLILQVGVMAAIMAAGFGTCCIGFVLLAIPYIGSVILLPIETTLRGLGPDFLQQFGPEWTIGSATPAVAPTPPAPSA